MLAFVGSPRLLADVVDRAAKKLALAANAGGPNVDSL